MYNNSLLSTVRTYTLPTVTLRVPDDVPSVFYFTPPPAQALPLAPSTFWPPPPDSQRTIRLLLWGRRPGRRVVRVVGALAKVLGGLGVAQRVHGRVQRERVGRRARRYSALKRTALRNFRNSYSACRRAGRGRFNATLTLHALRLVSGFRFQVSVADFGFSFIKGFGFILEKNETRSKIFLLFYVNHLI